MRFLLVCLLCPALSYAAPLLKDIGVVGLASHDMFTWDKKTETNTENGRLDLSTIFDYDEGSKWKTGGNKKNSENAPVYTVTMTLVNFYKAALKTHTKDNARRLTVKLFHTMVKDSFERLIGQDFPTFGIDLPVTNVEQAAMRGLHDILPGRAKLYDRLIREELILTDAWTAKTFLSDKEMNQEIKNFDGDYDIEYQHIKIPFMSKEINLKTIDGAFIEKFSSYKQADMLAELKRVGDGEILIHEVSFIGHLVELFGKGICSKNNVWMDHTIHCL